MLGPTIEPSEVGVTGLLWLFFSYGYMLYFASNLISEGSELLLLVPSMAGLVGGVVLPLLGAVPDGAIILFSGLGSLEEAQETLSVGVGALAGSTIMLLTIPFGLSVYGGRVDIDQQTGNPNYLGRPKLTAKDSFSDELRNTGVTFTENVNHGAVIMCITTLPYFLIQLPASFMHGEDEVVAKGEKWWALSGLIICLLGLTWYMRLQLKLSREGEDRDKRMAVMKKMLNKGAVSLSGAMAAHVKKAEQDELNNRDNADYQAINQNHNKNSLYPPPSIAEYLKEVLADAFMSYDNDGNGELDRNEVFVFFKDFHETISEQEMSRLFDKYDTDNSGLISLDEFIGLAYSLIKAQNDKPPADLDASVRTGSGARMQLAESAFSEVEEEEIPEQFTDLSPDEQQAAIKKQAFTMLAIGTFLVVMFSDPMVDVMQEIAVRAHLPAFYVSFVLAPLASNASEVISSMYYASKKTRKTISVSITALEGAACMNNTFCLSIFMGLVFFRGLAWHYTAETISIVLVEFVLSFLCQKSNMTMFTGLFVMAIFPLSLVLVATLEAIGFD